MPKLTLYDWQQEDADWMMGQNSLLANDCGLGKTLTAIEAVKQNARGPILVIAPRMVKEWWAETIRTQEAGLVGVCQAAGRGIPWDKVAQWGNKRPLAWVITHPEAVRISYQHMLRINWDIVIVDEAHRFKNRKAKQTKALWKIQSRRKLMLTATPYGKSPADMWALLHYMYPRTYTSYWRFYDKYVAAYKPPGQQFSKVTGGKNLPELAKEVSSFYRRRDISMLNLPPFTYSDVPVLLNPRQEELYLTLVRDLYTELLGTEIILQNAMVKFLRLQQCALDPGTMNEDFPQYPLDEVPAKVEWIFDWLNDHPNEPVVITSRYRRFVEK